MRVSLIIMGVMGIVSFTMANESSQFDTTSVKVEMFTSESIFFDDVCCTRSSTTRDAEGNIKGQATVTKCMDDTQVGCEEAERITCNNAQHSANIASRAQRSTTLSPRPW